MTLIEDLPSHITAEFHSYSLQESKEGKKRRGGNPCFVLISFL